MTSRSTLRPLFVALAALSLTTCLKSEVVPPIPDKCNCNGVRCVNSSVGKLEPSQDTGEGDDPCLTCHVTQIGECADACTRETFDVPGCPVAYACKTWSRAKVGAACGSTFDCEPGLVGGQPQNTLACQDFKCVDLGDKKFSPPPPIVECTGDQAFYGASACNGGACLGETDYSDVRHCAAARCIDDSDCPANWHCRCAEQTTPTGLRGWRWCVPSVAGPDAGTAATDGGH